MSKCWEQLFSSCHFHGSLTWQGFLSVSTTTWKPVAFAVPTDCLGKGRQYLSQYKLRGKQYSMFPWASPFATFCSSLQLQTRTQAVSFIAASGSPRVSLLFTISLSSSDLCTFSFCSRADFGVESQYLRLHHSFDLKALFFLPSCLQMSCIYSVVSLQVISLKYPQEILLQNERAKTVFPDVVDVFCRED